MDHCDVLIVGGGPAGSSCAWKLRNSGLDVVVLDKNTFPRNKVCGGWITPAVLTELEIDAAEYARRRVLQPITSFLTGSIGGPLVETTYGEPVSYGIRRREFDDYLLRRCGARFALGAPLSSLERKNDRWIVNSEIEARMLVGAGGHFCPVAKKAAGKATREDAVVAQEAEFEMDGAQVVGCRVEAERPELYFCADMKGYGWCFRKENFLNVGLGRMDQHRLSEHVAAFLHFLKSEGRLDFDLPAAMLGHAYLLYGNSTRRAAGDGFLLIGDAAGLAYAQSGEGIRPAIESGLMAGDAILDAQGNYSQTSLESYAEKLAQRFGESGADWASIIGQRLPAAWVGAAGRQFLTTRWFTRNIVIHRWFLHSGQAPLVSHRKNMAAEVPSLSA